MGARFDHLVIAVEDLDDAVARWRAAGLPAERGGAHPVGTENALVRGPAPAYVELIAAGRDESNPWLDRVRSARGPISWAIAVDDVDEAHAALVAAGFEPGPVREGSRTTLAGDEVAWRMCDVGPGPYDGSLPFLIQWTTPMEPGPAHGPVVAHLSLTPPDPDRVADLLLALGFVPSRHWPRRMLHEAGSRLSITLGPPGEPEGLDAASWSMSWTDADEPPVSLALSVSTDEGLARSTLDGVLVTTHADRRRIPASRLQPTSGAHDCRLRAEAWVEAIQAAGLAEPEPAEVAWAAPINVEPTRAVRLRGPAGTQPITVVWGNHPVDGEVVVVGVGEPVEVLERQPEPGGAPSDVPHEVDRIDDAFVLALGGGVYAIRGRRRSVVRNLDGYMADGPFADGEPRQWLEQAAAGRRTEGVVAGEPWLS